MKLTKQTLFRGVIAFQPVSTLAELPKPIPIASSQALITCKILLYEPIT